MADVTEWRYFRINIDNTVLRHRIRILITCCNRYYLVISGLRVSTDGAVERTRRDREMGEGMVRKRRRDWKLDSEEMGAIPKFQRRSGMS